MADDVDFERLQKYLECAICLDIFTDPRMLSCRHQFCKECLDAIVSFNADGSAIIHCPIKCGKPTIIGQNQTTNDLGGSYEFSGMLEILRRKVEVSGVPKCTFTKECQNEVTVYCCEIAMCKQCEAKHNLSTQCRRHYGKTTVSFDTIDGKLKVVCDEHLTKCTHICSDNTFLCMFCLNRKHKNHERNTIEHEVFKVKQTLEKDSILKQKIDDVLNETMANISFSKSELDKALRERKIRCLSNYLDFLNAEEDLIKKEFGNLTDSHISQYDIAAGCNFNEDVDLLVRRNMISENLSVKLSKSPISYLTVSLSNDFHFHGEKPLGRLIAANDNEGVPLHRYSFISSFDAHFDKIKNFDNISRKFAKEMETLLPKKEAVYFPKAECKSRFINKAKAKTFNLVSMNDIVHFFQCKKTATLKSLIKTCPWIVEMQTKSSGDYLAHLAVKHDNLEVLKAIFKHDNARYDVKNAYGQTLLTLATHLNIYSPPETCFDWLIEEFPQLINTGDNKGKTPLHYAARSSSVQTLQYLLRHGADIDKSDLEGHNAIHHATSHGRINCLKELQRVLCERDLEEGILL